MSIFYRFLIIGFLADFVIFRSSAQSQSQSTAPYIVFKTTYALPASPQKIDQLDFIVQNKRYSKGLYGSYGSGMAFSLGIGKMLNPTFGVELNAEYLSGKSVNESFSDTQSQISGDLSRRAESLLIKPLIVIRNSGDLLSIYTKLGLVITTVANIKQTFNATYVLGGQASQITSEAKETANLKVGFAACFGVSFRVSESLSVLVEANGQILSLPLSKGHYTSYTINGQDQLPTMTASKKPWIYEKEGYFEETQPDPNQPESRLFNPAYFSYVGVGIGFMYHF